MQQNGYTLVVLSEVLVYFQSFRWQLEQILVILFKYLTLILVVSDGKITAWLSPNDHRPLGHNNSYKAA